MKRSFLRALVGTTAMVGAAMVALPNDANAALITGGGQSFSVNFLLAQNTTDPNGNQNLIQDIIGEVQFDVTSFNVGANSVAIQVTFKNATLDQGNEVGFWKLGFGTDPNATGVNFQQVTPPGDTNKFTGAVLGAPGAANAFPNSAVIDVTGTTGQGANNTLREQQTDTFLLTIGFGSSIANGVNFDPFNTFVQTDFQVGGSSFQFAGNTPPPSDVPEPASLALLGLGLLGLGYATRRRRQAV